MQEKKRIDMKKGFALQYLRCHFNVAFSGSAVLKVKRLQNGRRGVAG
jgi:hypothetical protein